MWELIRIVSLILTLTNLAAATIICNISAFSGNNRWSLVDVVINKREACSMLKKRVEGEGLPLRVLQHGFVNRVCAWLTCVQCMVHYEEENDGFRRWHMDCCVAEIMYQQQWTNIPLSKVQQFVPFVPKRLKVQLKGHSGEHASLQTCVLQASNRRLTYNYKI